MEIECFKKWIHPKILVVKVDPLITHILALLIFNEKKIKGKAQNTSDKRQKFYFRKNVQQKITKL